MTKAYKNHHIGKAKSATIAFLWIGRFHTIHPTAIPYDVIRLIAKKVWESRYENQVWNIPIVSNSIYDDYHYQLVSEENHDYMEWYRDSKLIPNLGGKYFGQHQYFQSESDESE